jgi:hypothetical protein
VAIAPEIAHMVIVPARTSGGRSAVMAMGSPVAPATAA